MQLHVPSQEEFNALLSYNDREALNGVIDGCVHPRGHEPALLDANSNRAYCCHCGIDMEANHD